jgi:sarcosine oxidase
MASKGARGYDAIVLGVGTMGSAACLALARRGLRVLGLEQFDIPNAMGSHHGHSRMFRLAYFEHPDYVPLLRRSLEMWTELNAATGLEVFRTTGGVYLGTPDGPTVGDSAAAARRHGLPHEVLDRAELRHRYPAFHVPDDFAALYEPSAGFIRPELAVAAMAGEALRLGADIRGRQSVLDWGAEAGGIQVRTMEGTFEADRLVLAAGAWSGQVIRGLDVPLVVTRQVLGWVWPRRPELFGLGRFPCWAIEAPDGGLYYGFPMFASNPGFKVARHFRGEPTEPDSVDRTPRPSDESSFRPALRYLPDADGPTLAMTVCMYTNSPDSHFIIDLHPDDPRVALACGFSGHGFKFAPVVGEALADLAMHGRSDLPIGFLGLHPFTP